MMLNPTGSSRAMRVTASLVPKASPTPRLAGAAVHDSQTPEVVVDATPLISRR